MGSHRPRADAAFPRLKNNLLHPNVPKYRKKQRRLRRICEKMTLVCWIMSMRKKLILQKHLPIYHSVIENPINKVFCTLW